MPAWPGGACPFCGENAPENSIRCRTCGKLLNEDLRPGNYEKPEFQPLPEVAEPCDAATIGFYVACPNCGRDLKIRNEFRGEQVRCKGCHASFTCDPELPGVELKKIYTDCPHCHERLKADPKYLNQTVACKHCGGKIRFLDAAEA